MATGLLLFGIRLAGFACGSAARFLVPGEQRFTLAETTLIGIAGAGVGSILVNLVASGRGLGEFDPASIIGGLVGSILVLAAATFVASAFGLRSEGSDSTPIDQILRDGESNDVEFKTTARWNVHTGGRDDRMELAVAKTVAGFLNGKGGILVIGADDTGAAVGLDSDLGLMKSPDHDRFELWLSDHLERTLGKPALAYLSIRFEPVGAVDVVVIDVEPAEAPVFVDEPKGNRTADFYVRMGNSTRRLLTDEFERYRKTRWK
jgi:uncharacterized membrane protein YeaQ/YmgE (transglycosylase-associated protein family)